MKNRLLFIDTETGGLDAYRCSLLSIGAVVWEDGLLVASMEIFVTEPEIQVDPESQSIHGIDLDWLRAHGLSPIEAVARIEAFIADHFDSPTGPIAVPIAGHNVAFDVSFLRRLYRLTQRDYDRVFSHRTLDTAGIVRFLNIAGILQIEGAGSTAAFEHFGIRFEDRRRHSALGDAQATALLFTKLVEAVQRTYA